MSGSRMRSKVATAARATLLACVLSSCTADRVETFQPGLGVSESTQAGRPEFMQCPPVPSLSAQPHRIVTMDGGAAAILTELGVGNRIVGTASQDFYNALAERNRNQLKRIPVIDPHRGSAEAVINAKPDLVVGVSVYSFGGFDGTPTVDQLHRAGAQVLVACQRSARTGPVKDLSVTTSFIDEAARLLKVSERGDELNGRIGAEIEQARPTPGMQPLRVLVLSTIPVAGQPMVTLGGRSLANGVIALAGGQNIAGDIDEDFTSLSSEAMVARDPQAIVVMTGFATVSDEDLTRLIRDNPVLAGTTAVRHRRLVAVPQSILLSPSMLNGAAVTLIADALRGPVA